MLAGESPHHEHKCFASSKISISTPVSARTIVELSILSGGFHTNMIAIILDKPVVKPLNI